MVRNCTQLGNQIRGLLAEYGIIVPLHLHQLWTHTPQLTSFAQELFAALYAELCSIDERITAMERHIQQAFHREEACQKMAEIGGVEPEEGHPRQHQRFRAKGRVVR
jgi:transposase